MQTVDFYTKYFSLRTSETNYLNEAFSFYAAIRGRAYYSRATREDRYTWENLTRVECEQMPTSITCFIKIPMLFQVPN